MIFRLKWWYLFSQIVLVIGFIAFGLNLIFQISSSRIIEAQIFFGAVGFFSIFIGLFTLKSIIVSINIDGNDVSFSYILQGKKTIAIKRMIFGDLVEPTWSAVALRHVPGFATVLRINEGREAINLNILYFNDWKTMVSEMENATGVKIPNKAVYLKI